MRARLALRSAGIEVELREIKLRDKPEMFLATSKSKTVPVLALEDGTVIEESRDIMFWALSRSGDPENWLAPYHLDKQAVDDFLDKLDGPFKTDLDRYKYATRFSDNLSDVATNQLKHRKQGAIFLQKIEDRLVLDASLSGQEMGILDFACLPFIRQFRLADMHWFDAQDWPHLHRWLAQFLVSDRFTLIMEKYPVWQPGQEGVRF